MKKIIRLIALLMIMAICFSSLISCGECKHKNQTPTVYTATCTSRGYTLWICDDCHLQVRRENEVEMLPHTYDMTKCGTTQKCLYCNYTVKIEHEFEKGQTKFETTCKNCKKTPFTSLSIPTLPIELYEKNASGKITDSYEITKIEPHLIEFSAGSFKYCLKLTVARVYPNNLSGDAKIAWKLYKNGTEVVCSGQEYSSTSIAKGESSTIIIEDISPYAWEDGYSLKFLNLRDT